MGQDNPLSTRITLPAQTTTLYKALNAISDLIGYYFIYDSEVLNSDKQVTLAANDEPVSNVLNRLLNNGSLAFRVVEQHILIYRVEARSSPLPSIASPISDSLQPTFVNGKVIDKVTKKPIPYVSVGIARLAIGTITNTDGNFVLTVPPTANHDTIVVSHLGYRKQSYPVGLAKDGPLIVRLETDYISIQEVIIRGYDPVQVIEQALTNRKTNYANEPVYLTAFYREGVEKNKTYLSYSEAVFKLYKTSIFKSPDLDQVKLLKSRKIIQSDQHDTLTIKIKAGISATLYLDLVRSIPDFLDRSYMHDYHYQRSEMVTIDSKSAYAITFVQNEGITDPLYKGVIYIETDNLAILGVDFEVNPDFVESISSQLVVRKSRAMKVVPERVSYSVRYKKWGEKYYLNHIRGDIFLRVRKRNHIFSNSYHTYLEMATIQLDTMQVTKFTREEIVKPSIIFSDANFSYDPRFWGDYNYIVPEESLSEALSRVALKIESTAVDR